MLVVRFTTRGKDLDLQCKRLSSDGVYGRAAAYRPGASGTAGHAAPLEEEIKMKFSFCKALEYVGVCLIGIGYGPL